VTTAQWIYALLLVGYAGLFLFFSRVFYWKYYADKNHYARRPGGLSEQFIADLAREKNREIPRFSIFVPARNEADVIERTIDHLAELHYSPDHYEVLVVTDEKEVQAAQEERQHIREALTKALAGEAPWPHTDRHQAVLIALLSRLSLEAAELAGKKAGYYLSVQEILSVPAHQRQQILQEMAQTLLTEKQRFSRERLCKSIQRALPRATESEIAHLYPIFLSFAIPTVMAAAQLKNEHPDRLLARMMSEAAQARQRLTQKVLTALSETISTQVVRRVESASAETLAQWIDEACVAALPTTQEIVERKRREFAARRDVPGLKHVIVPWDFDGYVDGVCTGRFIPSTKGRALNYAFRFADDRSTMWGFYDAESRPHKDVLLYVAARRLEAGETFQVAQGPVLQVRNFWQDGPVCKVAALYQAVSHEWQIPWQLRSFPVIGGTNFYMDRNLMLKIGGFDNTVLSEDMELGVRAWLKGDAWPEFLPYPSSEQTPTSFKAFFRQRLRWGTGFLQVYDKVKADLTLPADRRKRLLRRCWWQGHFSWTLFQLIALLPIVVTILYWNGLIDPTGVPEAVKIPFRFLAPFYLGFTYYCFFHFRKYIEPAPRAVEVTGLAQLLLLPVCAFFLPTPYSTSLVLKWTGHQPKGWVKTPRTKE